MPNSPDSLRHNSDIEVDYDVLEVLGGGTSGVVHRLVKRDTHAIYAGKVLDVSSEDNAKDFVVEVQRLMDFASEYTVQVFATYNLGDEAWIVMEHCSGGSLHDILCAIGEPFSEKAVQMIVAHVLLGLDTLHDMQFAHQDIKASNLLLTSAGRVKLCDFGVVEGTLHWMAPELLVTSKPCGDELLPCDVWALGITILELSTGCTPHAKVANRAKVVQAIQSHAAPTLPPSVSSSSEPFSADMADFVSRCLQKTPKDRATVRQLLQHNWVQDSIYLSKPHDNGSTTSDNILHNLVQNLAALKQEKEDKTAAFMREQEIEQRRRAEEEQEEQARDDMEASEQECREVLREERVAAERADMNRTRLETEARAAEEAARQAGEESEREVERTAEVEARGCLSGEDWRSRLVEDAVSASELSLQGTVLKQSDVLGLWNSRHFVVDRTLIAYFNEENDGAERSRYVVTGLTEAKMSGTSPAILEIQNHGPVSWTLRLNCEGCNSGGVEVWHDLIQKCIHYAKHVKSVHIERRIGFLGSGIVGRGWVRKVSEYLGQLNRRFVVLDRGVLRYYDWEDEQGGGGGALPRGQYSFSAATTVQIHARDEQMVTVEDLVAGWDITFEAAVPAPPRRDGGAEASLVGMSPAGWASVIRAHIALVS